MVLGKNIFNSKRDIIVCLAMLYVFGFLPFNLAVAQVAATVGDAVITIQEVETAYKRTSLSQRDKEISREKRQANLEIVLNWLIDQRLIHLFLNQEQVTVPESTIEKHINEMDAYYRGSGTTLEAFLARNGVSQEAMKAELRDLHRWAIYAERIATTEALQDYFNNNLAIFDESQVRLSHILVKVKHDAPEQERIALKQRLEMAKQEFLAGKSFSDLVKRYSECSETKNQHGDFGWRTRRNKLPEEIMAVAFNLTTGQVSEIVESPLGFHLILVTERKVGRAIDFEDVKEDVEIYFVRDQREAILKNLRREMPVIRHYPTANMNHDIK